MNPSGLVIISKCSSVRDFCENLFEVFCGIHHFLIRFLLVGFHLLFVGFNLGLHDDELFIRLVIHIFAFFWYLED